MELAARLRLGATAAAIAVLAGACGGPAHDQPAPPSSTPAAVPPPTASHSATMTPAQLARRLRAKDRNLPPRADLASYEGKIRYLQQHCTEHGAELFAIIQRVHTRIRAERDAGWYGALSYMTALTSGPRATCNDFASKA